MQWTSNYYKIESFEILDSFLFSNPNTTLINRSRVSYVWCIHFLQDKSESLQNIVQLGKCKFAKDKLLEFVDYWTPYLRNMESFLNNIICMRILKQLLKVIKREQFMDDLRPGFNVTEVKTLLNNMAAKLLGGEMNIIVLKLRSQLGCSRRDFKLQNKLNNIISAATIFILPSCNMMTI